MKTNTNLNKELFTIGEVAEVLGVDQHVIRFWTSQFANYVKPIRKAGLRRYYNKEDMEYLIKIKEELYNKGLSIRGLQLQLQNKESNNKGDVSTSKSKKNLAIIKELIEDLNQEIYKIDNCLEGKKSSFFK